MSDFGSSVEENTNVQEDHKHTWHEWNLNSWLTARECYGCKKVEKKFQGEDW